MYGKGMLSLLFIGFLQIFIFGSNPQHIYANNNEPASTCLDQAIERINSIKKLPEKKYLRTLDGQEVLLDEFYTICNNLFPWCTMFEKFYYWDSEIKTIISTTPNGQIRHKIKCYYNCLSKYCPKNSNSRKQYGDVAEYYDAKGKFMGLSVYVGDGKYCPLPFRGYRK